MSEYNRHGYEQLAGFLEKLSHDRYTSDSLFKSLSAAHILSRDGEVNTDRLERFMGARLIKIPDFDSPEDTWQLIVDSDSF